MTTSSNHGKSLGQLEREAEQNRALLAGTVVELRDRVQLEASAFRERISPAHIKAEAGEYIRSTGQAWRDSLAQRARENPLQIAAIGVGLAYPLWKIFRNIPAPLLLIGAGIALTHKSALQPTSSGSFPDAKDNVRSAVAGLTGDIADAANAGTRKVSSGIDTARSNASSTVDSLTSTLTDQFSAATEATSSYASAASDKLVGTWRDGSRAMSGAQDRGMQMTAQAGRSALSLFENNPLLIGAAGLVLGAIVAAAIPSTELESSVLEKAAPDLKQKAVDLIDKGYAAASATVGSAYDNAVEHARDHGLSAEFVQSAVENLGDKLRSVADVATGQDHADAAEITENTSSAKTSELKS